MPWRGHRDDPVCPQDVDTPDVGADRGGPEPDEACPQPDGAREGEDAQQFAQFEEWVLQMMNDVLRARGVGLPRSFPSDYPRV